MRANESPDTLPPEALERLKREEEDRAAEAAELAREKRIERDAKIVGLGIMSAGALAMLLTIVIHGTIETVAALAITGVIMAGGLVFNPTVYEAIVVRAIDALPGGKH